MLVSVCTIARNEEEYLPHLLEDITKQDYPAEQIEVVMVDSSSTDGTRRIMERFAEENPQYHNCVVTENPGNNQASGRTWTHSGGFCFQERRMHGKRRICHWWTKTESSGEGHTVAETSTECGKFDVRKWNRRFPERE